MNTKMSLLVEGEGRAHGHPDEVLMAHERALVSSTAQSRYIEAAGKQVHVIDAGDGPPLVLLHGSGPTALEFLPLLERFSDVRAIAVDRPGFGLSEPAPTRNEAVRGAAVDSLTSILDCLGLAKTSLLGNSMGGTWALWYALAHPERVSRLVLLGAPPLLPGTRVPPPLLSVADPTGVPAVPPPPSRESVVQSMGVFGEAHTIVQYPDLVAAMVAAGSDRTAAHARLSELQAVIAPTGWQPSLELKAEELRSLAVATLLIWGEHDPLVDSDAARVAASAIPVARLELLDAGHAPWLGYPERVAAMVRDFMA